MNQKEQDRYYWNIRNDHDLSKLSKKRLERVEIFDLGIDTEGFIDQSNHDAIEKRLAHYFNIGAMCWVFGMNNGIAVLAEYRNGKETPAYVKLVDLQADLEKYPILDSEAHSRLEYEATLENIWTVANTELWEFTPDNTTWQNEVFTYFWQNDPSAVECTDSHSGGYPSKKQMLNAFLALGYCKSCMHCQERTANKYICDDCIDNSINENDFKPINDTSLYTHTLL